MRDVLLEDAHALLVGVDALLQGHERDQPLEAESALLSHSDVSTGSAKDDVTTLEDMSILTRLSGAQEEE